MILVNGCSFTECYTLPDPNQSWPELLAKAKNTCLVNLARGGGSNARIMRTTQEWLYTHQKPSLVIIGWTSYQRGELPSYNGQYIRLTPQGSIIEDISLHHNPDVDMLHKIYYSHCYNDYLALTSTLLAMIALGKILSQLQIPYVFFNAINHNHLPDIIAGQIQALAKSAFEFYAHEPVQYPESIPMTVSHLRSLVDVIDQNNFLWWPNGTYLDQFQHCDRDSTGHFLEEGNFLMAQTLSQII